METTAKFWRGETPEDKLSYMKALYDEIERKSNDFLSQINSRPNKSSNKYEAFETADIPRAISPNRLTNPVCSTICCRANWK